MTDERGPISRELKNLAQRVKMNGSINDKDHMDTILSKIPAEVVPLHFDLRCIYIEREKRILVYPIHGYIANPFNLNKLNVFKEDHKFVILGVDGERVEIYRKNYYDRE